MGDPTVSIIMTAYNRAPLLNYTLRSIKAQGTDAEVIVIEDGNDGGCTRRVCETWGARYLQRVDRPDTPYSNQAPLLNAGIRTSRGEVLIIQNAECEHMSSHVIRSLVEPHYVDYDLAVFAASLRLEEEVEPTNLTSPYFFCGSVRREWMMGLQGLDEDFKGWGSEDDDLAARMAHVGMRFVYRPDIMTYHQFHGKSDKVGQAENRQLFYDKLDKLQRGQISPVANQGREWGVIA